MADDTPQTTIEEQIRAIFIKQLGIDEDEITNESSFKDDLGADSLDLVEVVMALEERFNINIPDEDAENIETLGHAVAYIQQRLAQEHA